jgi:hypothetical protein
MIAEGELTMRPCTRVSSERARKALPLMCLLLGLTLAIFCSGQVFADEQGDDFNDGIKNTDKWGLDEVKNHGKLSETRGRLEYVTGTSTYRDSSDRPWVLRQFPSNANWWIQIDATNTTSPVYTPGKGQFSSFGINVRNIRGASNTETGNEIEVELAAFGQYLLPTTRGFLAEFNSYLNPNPNPDSAMQPTQDTSAPIRLFFDSSTKIFTVFYDANPGPNYQWIDFGTFGVGGSGVGNSGNADWELTADDKFVVYVFGYSNDLVVKDGEMYGDNFLEDGGTPWVGPPPGPSPGPTGRFRFANNPLLTAIASIMGHYTGVVPGSTPRNYSIDIAQDESGKLSAMSTVQGIQDKNGSDNLSAGNIGAIKTVNGEPMVQLKGSFTGSRDGLPATLSGTAAVPAKVTPLVGLNDGFEGAGSYKGKLNGVPFVGKNLPIQVEAPPGAAQNVKKDWMLQLDFATKQPPKGKSYIVASSQLVLPNGDTIVFTEKRTAYNKKTGYTVSFSRGTNITAIPQRLDKKTSISIKGMTLVKQGAVWQPTGGTLTYQFFGQKGSGNLVDFIPPP